MITLIIYKSILISQLYNDNSKGYVGVELARWVISPQSATLQFWQTGKCLWTSWPCYGRTTSLVLNTSSSVSCWQIQITSGEYLLNLDPNGLRICITKSSFSVYSIQGTAFIKTFIITKLESISHSELSNRGPVMNKSQSFALLNQTTQAKKICWSLWPWLRWLQ